MSRRTIHSPRNEVKLMSTIAAIATGGSRTALGIIRLNGPEASEWYTPFAGVTLSQTAEGCLVIDLASRPGGVDFAGAAQLGVKVIWALSLPGKVAPVTSGQISCDTIYHMLQEGVS